MYSTRSLSFNTSLFAKYPLRVPLPFIWIKSVGRKDGTHQANIQQVGTIITCCHHANGYTYSCLTCFVRSLKLPVPLQVVISKVDGDIVVHQPTREVTCTAKSDWYLPGYILSANSFNISVIFPAWFWLTQNTIVFPISSVTGSCNAFSKNVLQKTRFVFSEKNFFSKSL